MGKKIRSLTGIRAIMMFIIILSHMEFLSKYSYGQFYERYLFNGRMGVDYFFLMSGFGMMLSERTYQVSAKNCIKYALEKIKKIYPVYVFSLLVVLPYAFLYEWECGNSITHMVRTIGIKFVLCLSLMQSAIGKASLATGLNSVAWFLSSLFIIYIVSPYLMRWIKKNNDLKKMVVCLAITGGVIFGMANFINLIDLHLGTMFLYYSPYFRVFYVIVGMELAQIYQYIKKIEKPDIWGFVSTILGIVWFFFRNIIVEKGNFNVGMMILCEITVVGLILFTFSFEEGVASGIVKKDFWVKAGSLSMYLFLLHYPIRMYVDYFLVKRDWLQNEIGGLIEVVIIYAISWIVAKKINNMEKKLRNT